MMDRVTFDLGIVTRNDYYTGVVFQGYLEGAGDIVLSGGRYDKLLSDYGVDLPAVGFGIHVDSIAQAVRKELRFRMLPDVLVYAYPGYEVNAFREVEKLISLGFQAEFCVCDTAEEAKTYASRKGVPTVYLVGEDVVEVRV